MDRQVDPGALPWCPRRTDLEEARVEAVEGLGARFKVTVVDQEPRQVVFERW